MSGSEGMGTSVVAESMLVLFCSCAVAASFSFDDEESMQCGRQGAA